MTQYQVSQYDSKVLPNPCRRVDLAQTKQEALEKAQAWCKWNTRSATIRRRNKVKVIMRYWRDTEGLQFMEY